MGTVTNEVTFFSDRLIFALLTKVTVGMRAQSVKGLFLVEFRKLLTKDGESGRARKVSGLEGYLNFRILRIYSANYFVAVQT